MGGVVGFWSASFLAGAGAIDRLFLFLLWFRLDCFCFVHDFAFVFFSCFDWFCSIFDFYISELSFFLFFFFYFLFLLHPSSFANWHHLALLFNLSQPHFSPHRSHHRPKSQHFFAQVNASVLTLLIDLNVLPIIIIGADHRFGPFNLSETAFPVFLWFFGAAEVGNEVGAEGRSEIILIADNGGAVRSISQLLFWLLRGGQQRFQSVGGRRRLDGDAFCADWANLFARSGVLISHILANRPAAPN